MSWEKKFNAIAKQMKTDSSRITPQEWNFIVNVLKEQANNNTEGVDYLEKETNSKLPTSTFTTHETSETTHQDIRNKITKELDLSLDNTSGELSITITFNDNTILTKTINTPVEKILDIKNHPPEFDEETGELILTFIGDIDDENEGIQKVVRVPINDFIVKALEDKVDKINGESLVPDGEIAKLAGIAEGAQVNVKSNWDEEDTNSDAFIQGKPTIPTVPVISTNIETDADSDAKTASPKSVKTYVDGKLSVVYKASGSLAPDAITQDLLNQEHQGNVYNINAQFTTNNSLFKDENERTYPVGTNIVVVYSEEAEAYRFDILAGFIDFENLIPTNLVGDYTVTFYNYEDEPVSYAYPVANGTVSPPTPEAVEGYDFIGWDKTLKNITSNLNVRPIYAIKKFTIKFFDKNNALVDTQTVDFEGTAIAPTLDGVVGYEFIGWDIAFENVNKNLDVRAQYEILTYTVTFVNHLAETITTETVEHGDDVAAPIPPPRTGYTFNQWSSPLTNIINSITITAEYIIKTYSVRFRVPKTSNPIPSIHNSSSWEQGTFQSIPHGSDATLPDDPILVGYTFDGWNADHTNITSSGDIFATFTLNEYEVNFYDEDGTTLLKTHMVNHFANAVPPETDPTKVGYTFFGWGKAYGPITAPTNFIAVFGENAYDVKFYDFDNTLLATLKVIHNNSLVNLPPDPVREGYTFLAWEGNYSDVVADENLYATYEINQYTITFDTDGGSLIEPITLDYMSPIIIPTNPTKENSEFSAWEPELPFYMTAENQTHVALWDLEKHLVRFFTRNNILIVEASQEVSHGSHAILPDAPVEVGWDFKFWNGPSHMEVTEPRDLYAFYMPTEYDVTFIGFNNLVLGVVKVQHGFNATLITPPDIEGFWFVRWLPQNGHLLITENRTLTAVYEVQKFSITFRAFDSSILINSMIEYDKNAIPPSPPPREGYTFSHWEGSYINVKASADIYATYDRNFYTVVYKDFDGSVIDTRLDVEHGTDLVPPANPSHIGKTFSTWDTSSENVSSDLTIVAIYDVDMFTVRFETINNALIIEKIAAYGSSVTAPTPPVKEGHTFLAWDTDFSSITSNIIVKPTYSINQYTITYVTTGTATSVDPQTYDFNEEITLGITTAVSVDFSGWYLESSLVTLFDLTHMPAANITLYPKWTQRFYTVKFQDWDETEYLTRTVLEGHNAIQPGAHILGSVYDRLGYQAIGWDKDFTNVMENLVVTRTYMKRAYWLFLRTSMGSTWYSRLMEYEEAIDPITVQGNSFPSRNYYTFTGWHPEIPATMPAFSLTCYPQYTPNEYTLTFFSNGGSSVSPITQLYGTPLTLPIPTRAGYIFDGWFYSSALTTKMTFTTMIWTANLYAKWISTPKIYMGHTETDVSGITITSGMIAGLQRSEIEPELGSVYTNAIVTYAGARSLIVAYPATLPDPKTITRSTAFDETNNFINNKRSVSIDGVSYSVYFITNANRFEWNGFTNTPANNNPTPYEVKI